MRYALFLLLVGTPLAAQTLTLPTHPRTLTVGQSMIIRPTALSIIGRSSSVARVIATVPDTSVVRITYATGGQRYTALAPGVAVILWSWDRTDGQRITLLDTMTVIGPTPPVVVVEPLPPAGDLSGAWSVTNAVWADYPCARMLPGVRVATVRDTIVVTQIETGAGERVYCVPFNVAARSTGDPFRARSYPIEPNALLPGYVPLQARR